MNQMILQISSGQGPRECERFVVLLSSELCREACAAGLEIRELSEAPGRGDCAASLRFLLSGDGVAGFRACWERSVQWIWQSAYRPGHPRKNWFVRVSFRPPAETIALDDADVRIETFRASGLGGQHVNRTDSAVRAIHVPTGMGAVASEERSQIRNRKLALLRLAERMAQANSGRRGREDAELRQEHLLLERGSPIRVFRGLPLREK